jgi:hypothetical protein
MKIFTILILGLALILNSCATEKRLHRKGYYFSALKPQTQKGRVSAEKIVQHANNTLTDHGNLYALTETNIPADSCDEIILTDGTIIRGKVLEFIYNKVHFKLCDYPNRPSQIISKDDVFLIKYANGDKENFSVISNKPVKVDSVQIKSAEKAEDQVETKELVKQESTEEIILLNGQILKGKILEMSDESIKYKKANQLEGPTFVIAKSEVLLVRYKDGKTEVFNQKKVNQPATTEKSNNQYATEKEYQTGSFSTASLIMGLVALIPTIGLPFSVLAIIFSSIALVRSRNLFPDSRKTKRGQAVAGLVLGITTILAFLIVLLIMW